VGLGLALSRGLTEAMGGTLEPEDTPGGGLTMTLSLPAVPGPDGPLPGRRDRDQDHRGYDDQDQEHADDYGHDHDASTA
jgi:two-component system sensor histidine kinase KdpD